MAQILTYEHHRLIYFVEICEIKKQNFLMSSSLPSSSLYLQICLSSLSGSSQPSLTCSLFVLLFVSRLISSFRFVLTIEAQVGGVKKGDDRFSGGHFTTPQLISMDLSMNTTIRTTKFAFDLEPPYHCLSKSNNCSVFPIFLNRSMSSVSLTSTDAVIRKIVLEHCRLMPD